MSGEGGFGVLMAGAAVKGATTAIARNFIDQVVTPYLRGMGSKRVENVLRTKLSRYARIIEHRTRVVPTFVNSSGVLTLDEIYEPLTVHSLAGNFESLIDGYPSALFRQSRCVAITDDAGMGKSTLARYIVRRALSEAKNIPLLVELRRVRSGGSIVTSICEELSGAPSDSDEAGALIELFARGNFIFVFDGFDEVEESLRPAIVAEINLIASRFQFCYFVLTSRPEYSVSLFPEFFQVGIKKLTRHQAESLIRRYDVGKGLANLLLPKIDQAGVGWFLGNPLLVTLLYRAFDHRNSVPAKRTIFFRQVYDALFQDHDLSKGDAFSRKKESGLDSEDFHKLIRALGFETFKSGRVSYQESELLAFIDAASERSDLPVTSKEVLRDLVKAVPLFVRDGFEVKWSHKSFQEYFASQYILSDMAALRDDLIRRMFNSDEVIRYREIFRFLGECDVGLLRDLCVRPFLKGYADTCEDEEELGMRLLFNSVDLYYIGGMKKADYQKSVSEIVSERFNADIGARRTAMTHVSKSSFALLGVLKADGIRFLLLPVIDPKMFPEFTRESRSSSAKKWPKVYGAESFHVNPTLDRMREVRLELDSLECLEAAAHIYCVGRDVLVELERSAEKRRVSLARCVLDEF